MEMKIAARTEEEILGKLPIEVKLGEKVYKIAPLTILKGMEWRKKLHSDVASVLETFTQPAAAPGFHVGLAAALLQFPEKLIELIFAYAPDLPKDEIMENATEEQIAHAFSRIVQVAYPFLAQLGTLTQAMKASSVR